MSTIKAPAVGRGFLHCLSGLGAASAIRHANRPTGRRTEIRMMGSLQLFESVLGSVPHVDGYLALQHGLDTRDIRPFTDFRA